MTINSHLAAWVAAAVFLGCLPDAAAKAVDESVNSASFVLPESAASALAGCVPS